MDYDGDKVFHQEIYFEGEFSPTKERVIEKLIELDEKYKDAPDYVNGMKKCIDMVKKVKDWQFVFADGMICTNTFVEHPILGKQPFRWEVIKPIMLK